MNRRIRFESWDGGVIARTPDPEQIWRTASNDGWLVRRQKRDESPPDLEWANFPRICYSPEGVEWRKSQSQFAFRLALRCPEAEEMWVSPYSRSFSVIARSLKTTLGLLFSLSRHLPNWSGKVNVPKVRTNMYCYDRGAELCEGPVLFSWKEEPCEIDVECEFVAEQGIKSFPVSVLF